MSRKEYIECYNAIQLLREHGILNEEEAAVHEHNLLVKILMDMSPEEEGVA